MSQSQQVHKAPRRWFTVILLAALAALALAAAPASADTQSFFNNTSLTIPKSGQASPLYPSPITVSGMTGPVTDVNLTMYRFGHSRPRDVQVLLVSPGGHKVMVMNANCGEHGIEDFTWSFDQQAPTYMPLNGETCDGFVYRPNAFVWDIDAPAYPAPPHPFEGSLDAFKGENPNGDWKLYVYDEYPYKSGDVEGGWSLTLTTGPVAERIPARGTSGPADPYPITTRIDATDSVITDLDVQIYGIWHQRPQDLDLLLVGPQGQSTILMSDACGNTEVTSATWTFDDEAGKVPRDGGDCGDRRYRPTNYDNGDDAGDSWPGAPAGTHSPNLETFDYTDPHGEWRLYVVDDSPGAVGFFTFGFQLRMETRQKASVKFAQSAATVEEGATGELTLRRSGGLLGAGSVALSSVPVSATSKDDFTPVSTTVQFGPGEREKKVKVDALADDAVEPDETYAVSINSPTGDARVESPASVVVTIPAPQPVDDGGDGDGSGGDAGGGDGSGGDAGGGDGSGGDTGGGSTGDGADTLAPVLTNARLSRRRVRVGHGGAALRFTSTEAASLAVTFDRARPGRRPRTAHAKCRPVKRPPKHGACTSYRRAGTVTRPIVAGDGAQALSGWIGRRRLAPGRYRLTLVATDAAGNRSKPVRLKLTIVR